MQILRDEPTLLTVTTGLVLVALVVLIGFVVLTSLSDLLLCHQEWRKACQDRKQESAGQDEREGSI